jgi:hypothetical protein
MASDPIVLVWERYGWLGFLGYVFVREVWPFLREKVWPVKVAQAQAERERLAKLEERTLNAEDRQVAAIEAMSKSVQDMALAITTNNERFTALITGFAIHAQDTNAAIALMRERTSPVEHGKGRSA